MDVSTLSLSGASMNRGNGSCLFSDDICVQALLRQFTIELATFRRRHFSYGLFDSCVDGLVEGGFRVFHASCIIGFLFWIVGRTIVPLQVLVPGLLRRDRLAVNWGGIGYVRCHLEK